MRGVRSFDSVPTCSGWGFSHIVRFPPLRMTIREERMDSYLGDMLRVLELTVLYYDTRERIVSHAWCQILRLSPHLFWLGLFTHRTFLSAQDDDTRGRKGSHLGDMLHVLELAVLYYDMSSPLEKGRAEGAGWIHEAV